MWRKCRRTFLLTGESLGTARRILVLASLLRSEMRLTFAFLGYPDYLPPRPGHDEEEMSEDLVKNGFQGRSLLSSSVRF